MYAIFSLQPLIRFTLILGLMGTAMANNTLTIYSARGEPLIQPVLEAFTAQTGIKTRLHTDKEAGIIARLQSEGKNTPADIMITVDAGNLWQASDFGLLQRYESPVLTQNIPVHLRDPQHQWYGFSVRARTIIYHKPTIDPNSLSTYQDLAEPSWKGKLCLRTSKKVYNQSLIAMMIEEMGEAQTEKVVRGWINNLAAPVFADDTALIGAVASGQCQVGIVNTYYLGRALMKTPDLPVGLFWANQKGSGVHVNISGAGIVAHTKNLDLAKKFMDFLSSDKAQQIYTDQDLEYPANPKIKANSIIRHWGEFKGNMINVSSAGKRQKQAMMLMERSGYQ